VNCNGNSHGYVNSNANTFTDGETHTDTANCSDAKTPPYAGTAPITAVT
jgi:hypothetical protein